MAFRDSRPSPAGRAICPPNSDCQKAVSAAKSKGRHLFGVNVPAFHCARFIPQIKFGGGALERTIPGTLDGDAVPISAAVSLASDFGAREIGEVG